MHNQTSVQSKTEVVSFAYLQSLLAFLGSSLFFLELYLADSSHLGVLELRTLFS